MLEYVWIEIDDEGKWVTQQPICVGFAELRAMRVAFWARLDPNHVVEAWPAGLALALRHWAGQPTHPQHEWIAGEVTYAPIEIPASLDLPFSPARQ